MPKPWELSSEQALAEKERLSARLCRADRIAAPLFAAQFVHDEAELRGFRGRRRPQGCHPFAIGLVAYRRVIWHRLASRGHHQFAPAAVGRRGSVDVFRKPASASGHVPKRSSRRLCRVGGSVCRSRTMFTPGNLRPRRETRMSHGGTSSRMP